MDLANYLRCGDENTPPVTPLLQRKRPPGESPAISASKLDPRTATPVEYKILGRMMQSSPPPKDFSPSCRLFQDKNPTTTTSNGPSMEKNRFSIFSPEGKSSSSSSNQQPRRAFRRLDNITDEAVTPGKLKPATTSSVVESNLKSPLLQDVLQDEEDMMMHAARSSSPAAAALPPRTDEKKSSMSPFSWRKTMPSTNEVLGIASPATSNYFLSSSSSESSSDNEDDRLDSEVDEILKQKSSAPLSSPYSRPPGPSSPMFKSFSPPAAVVAASSHSTTSNSMANNIHRQQRDNNNNCSSQRSELLLTPSPPESPARQTTQFFRSIHHDVENRITRSSDSPTVVAHPVAPSRTPVAVGPMSSPSSGSQSVERLLARAQAIRTPELAEQGKAQDWVSQRMFSAVKRFVFRSTGGQVRMETVREEDGEEEGKRGIMAAASGGAFSRPSAMKSDTAAGTSSMLVFDGESIEGEYADHHHDDRSIISDITSPGLSGSARRIRMTPTPAATSSSMTLSPITPPLPRSETYHGCEDIMACGTNPFPTGFPAAEISAPSCSPSGCGPALSDSRAKQQVSQSASMRPWGASTTCSLHRPELRFPEMEEIIASTNRLRLGPPSQEVEEKEEEKSVPTVSMQHNSLDTESGLSVVAMEAAATAALGGGSSVLSPQMPSAPPCSPSSPIAFTNVPPAVSSSSSHRQSTSTRLPPGLKSVPSVSSVPTRPTLPLSASQAKPIVMSFCDDIDIPEPQQQHEQEKDYEQWCGQEESSPTEEDKDEKGPCIFFREGQSPVLCQGKEGKDGFTSQPLREVRMAGFAGEAIIVRIPVKSIGPGPLDGRAPLIVKASVHYPASCGAVFQVSPTYLSLGPTTSYNSQLQTLNLRLVAERPGEYGAFLALEYMGTQAQISLRGVIRPKLDADGEGGWFAASSSSAAASPSTEKPTPVAWRRLLVGCSASREIQLRNIMRGPCFVQTCVEGAGFEVDGGGEIGAEGVLRLTLTFKPSCPGPHEGILRIIVWEGMRPGGVKLQSEDGRLDCAAGTGRRVYSISLTGTAYEKMAKRAAGRIRSRSVEASAAHAPSIRPPAEMEKEDADASVLSDDGDSLSLSGDSVLSLSMNKPNPVATASKARHNALRPISVFFHTPTIRFGKQDVGSVSVMKLPLCNPLAEPQLVMIEPLDLPFIILHRCIRLRPRSFVRLPIRFVPVAPGSFSFTLQATVHRISSVGASPTSPNSSPAYTLTVVLSGEGEQEAIHKTTT